MRLNHVALTVSDLTRSAAFYGKWLGMDKVAHQDDQFLILTNEHHDYLALTKGDVPPQPPASTHFGFFLSSAAEVHSKRAAFREAGVNEAQWQQDGTIRVQVFDPDGYRVDLYSFDFL